MPQSEFESLGSTLLVHVELPQAKSQEDLKELQLLAESGGGDVVFAFLVSAKRLIQVLLSVQVKWSKYPMQSKLMKFRL